MKKLILFLLITTLGFAQPGAPIKNEKGFFAGTGTMNASAIAQLDSTSKGFLFPRMTTTQRNAISSPATSLLIFNTTVGEYQFYGGSAWVSLGGGSSQDLYTTLGFGNTSSIGIQITGGAQFNASYSSDFTSYLRGDEARFNDLTLGLNDLSTVSAFGFTVNRNSAGHRGLFYSGLGSVPDNANTFLPHIRLSDNFTNAYITAEDLKSPLTWAKYSLPDIGDEVKRWFGVSASINGGSPIYANINGNMNLTVPVISTPSWDSTLTVNPTATQSAYFSNDSGVSGLIINLDSNESSLNWIKSNGNYGVLNTEALTGLRNWTLPNASGRLALSSEITGGSTYLVSIYHPNGTIDGYNPSANSNVARGIALLDAIGDAAIGDVVKVGVGTYECYGLQKNGITLDFAEGSIVEYTGSTLGAVIFDLDTATDIVMNVVGSGVFRNMGTGGGNDVIDLNNPDSKFTFIGKSIYSDNNRATINEGGVLDITVEDISSEDGVIDITELTPNTTFTTIHAKNIIGIGNYALEYDGGSLKVFAEKIEGLTIFPPIVTNGSNNGTVYVNATTLKSIGPFSVELLDNTTIVNLEGINFESANDDYYADIPNILYLKNCSSSQTQSGVLIGNGNAIYLDVVDVSDKEFLSNKQTNLTASATKYPTVNAVNTGLATKQNTITAQALTETDDTNVTLTLGGSPTTSLLSATSLTLGWTGTLADSRITSSSNWNTAFSNRITSLTTTGSGASTLSANVLNIPTPTLIGLGGISASSTETLTNKTWNGNIISNALGGTGQNSSAATGVARVSSGVWSWSTALPAGTTAITQTVGNNSTLICTTAGAKLEADAKVTNNMLGGVGVAPSSNAAASFVSNRPYTARTANYTLSSTLTGGDYLVECTANSFTTTLPTAVSQSGRQFVITNTGSGTITVATTASQTFINVSGTPTTLTIAQFGTVWVISNGTNWLRTLQQ